MIILLMFGSAIALFASVMFINQRTTRILGTVIFGVLFVGSTALMSLNYSHHFGMHQEQRHKKFIQLLVTFLLPSTNR